MSISVGIFAPDFILTDDVGGTRRLSDYRGQSVVLYFYPKDDTPGCTTEACNFRDDYSAYVDAGVIILGISPDSSKSHAKFKKKFQLPFPLLADEDHLVCEEYGVWGKKKFMGREYMGALRTTFVISPDGKVKTIFEDVKPSGHSAEVLAAIKE
ncbi:MAG: thioredoxin-dependent thiol peroxidase [Chloroflexi bacterium]|nr:thioredoxin-dependent thiol peroxidase [Chloroflexota bacterium]